MKSSRTPGHLTYDASSSLPFSLRKQAAVSVLVLIARDPSHEQLPAQSIMPICFDYCDSGVEPTSLWSSQGNSSQVPHEQVTERKSSAVPGPHAFGHLSQGLSHSGLVS